MKLKISKPGKYKVKNTLEEAKIGDFLLCVWFFPEEYWKNKFWGADGIERITVGKKYKIIEVNNIKDEISFENNMGRYHIIHCDNFDIVPTRKIFELIKKEDIYYL